jgi:high-affinity nickel-transport protein
MTAALQSNSTLLSSKLFVVLLVIVLLHLVGWTTLVVGIAPLHLLTGGQVLGIGIGITAYTLGVRHAFDADHIAAIDNTTRKLLGQQKSGVTVGFWFSLGHSSVVFGLSLVAATGLRLVTGVVLQPGSMFTAIAGTVGTIISIGFL